MRGQEGAQLLLRVLVGARVIVHGGAAPAARIGHDGELPQFSTVEVMTRVRKTTAVTGRPAAAADLASASQVGADTQSSLAPRSMRMGVVPGSRV